MDITVQIAPDVLSALKTSPDQFAQELRLAAAMFGYQQRQSSQEKAAQGVGLDRTDVLMAFARAQIDAVQVDFDDLKREVSLG